MMPSVPVSLAVLVSGEGSNLQALIDDPDPAYEIAVVISDRHRAGALDRADNAGIATCVIDWADFESRADFTSSVCDAAEAHDVSGLVLAGFMRILTQGAMERFPDAIINVHPALLPSFPGAHAVEHALAYGVTVTGVTVHFVDEQVDHGPIIMQRPVPVHSGDDASSLHERIQAVEHQLLPEVVGAFGRGDLSVEGRHVRWNSTANAGALQ